MQALKAAAQRKHVGREQQRRSEDAGAVDAHQGENNAAGAVMEEFQFSRRYAVDLDLLSKSLQKNLLVDKDALQRASLAEDVHKVGQVWPCQWTNCTILGRHFGRVSVPAHVRDKYKILMADRELAFVSGRARRLFPRVRFHFWPQRRRYTCILFLSCELPRSGSRQNRRARQRTDPLRPVI